MEERRKPCEDKAEDWNEVATSQRKPGITRSWKRQGKFSPGAFQREHGPADTWSLDFYP